MRNIRILIAAASPIVISGVQSILLWEPGFRVAAICNDVPTTKRAITSGAADVALVHESMLEAGLTILRMRSSELSSTRIAFLVSSKFDASIVSGLRADAFGLISTEAPPGVLGNPCGTLQMARWDHRVLSRTMTEQQARSI